MKESAIRRVGVVVKPAQPEALGVLCELIAWLKERGLELAGEPGIDHKRVEAATGCALEIQEPDALAESVDLLVVLGGDGTMIRAARIVGGHDVPVLGVNYGSLGYLAEFHTHELFPALEAILADDYRVDERVMLDVEVLRDGSDEQRMSGRVLNDVVINKSALARIIEIEARLNYQFVNSFRADGLIVSTPTGSTAYNLSAGGPVIYPSMEAVVVTPICPFTLSNRPIVVPDRALIELCIKTPKEEVAITLDGQVGFPLEVHDRVLIKKSRTTFKIVQPTNRNYFEVLRDKLCWGK
ncbi:MAG: NAD(+)/NADH kinase [Pyrinomonadaceae bacterium]